MKPYYISFGQIHTHSIDGKTFDKDSIAVIEATDPGIARDIAFKLFNDKWSMLYSRVPDMKFFPRGLINVN